jgi:hypothetical protein
LRHEARVPEVVLAEVRFRRAGDRGHEEGAGRRTGRRSLWSSNRRRSSGIALRGPRPRTCSCTSGCLKGRVVSVDEDALRADRRVLKVEVVVAMGYVVQECGPFRDPAPPSVDCAIVFSL